LGEHDSVADGVSPGDAVAIAANVRGDTMVADDVATAVVPASVVVCVNIAVSVNTRSKGVVVLTVVLAYVPPRAVRPFHAPG
jgi:hypothetical protein